VFTPGLVTGHTVVVTITAMATMVNVLSFIPVVVVTIPAGTVIVVGIMLVTAR
jgi:hypothetical protein